jgi:hypothetical protein
MNKLFKENGSLTEDGHNFIKPLRMALSEIFLSNEAQDMSSSELLILGSMLSSIVADSVSERILAKNHLFNKINAMTDEQFEAFLKVKYGKRWMLSALTNEEQDRPPKLNKEKIANLLKDGLKHITKFPKNGVRFK